MHLYMCICICQEDRACAVAVSGRHNLYRLHVWETATRVAGLLHWRWLDLLPLYRIVYCKSHINIGGSTSCPGCVLLWCEAGKQLPRRRSEPRNLRWTRWISHNLLITNSNEGPFRQLALPIPIGRSLHWGAVPQRLLLDFPIRPRPRATESVSHKYIQYSA